MAFPLIQFTAVSPGGFIYLPDGTVVEDNADCLRVFNELCDPAKQWNVERGLWTCFVKP